MSKNSRSQFRRKAIRWVAVAFLLPVALGSLVGSLIATL